MTEIDKEIVRLIKEYKIEPSKQLFTEDSLNDEILEWFENIKVDLIDFISSSLQLNDKDAMSFEEFKTKYFDKKQGDIYYNKITDAFVNANDISKKYQEYCLNF